MKKASGFVVKLAVTVGLFVLLFRPETFGLRADQFGEVTPRDMLNEVQQAGPRYLAFWLAFATVVKLTGMLCGVLRWRLLLRGQGLRIPFWYMVQSWFVGRAIGIFLPGTLGLDGYRLYDSSRYTGEVIKCTTVIVIEKLIGFIALTGLVFLTLPLGFPLLKSEFNVNLPLLVIILTILGGMVAAFFLLLLNPRVIQVIVSAIPTPGIIRNKLDKLGAAATAYNGNRSDLLLAVFFGILVHVGTCFMYFGTMMAVRADNTTLADVLFASPLMIYGTVLGPSVGGEGIREIIFAVLLSSKAGFNATVTLAHLGWWVGEVVPFVIGTIVYVFRTRPGRVQMEAELAKVRREAAGVPSEAPLHLTPEVVAAYRSKLIGCVLAGALAGLIAGGIIGLAEAGWIVKSVTGLHELALFWWGPLVYGLLFAAVGLGVAAGLTFLYLLVDRFAPSVITFALSLGGALGAGALVIGRFRYGRDVLAGHALSMTQNGTIVLAAVGLGLGMAILAAVVLTAFRRRGRMAGLAAGVAVYMTLVAAGGVLSGAMQPAPVAKADFQPREGVQGPNILLVAVDALRADYLRLFAETAVAKTPRLEAFRTDAVLFPNAFAQSTWTKPSFATLFSGMYPGAHTATTKVSSLPHEIDTLAEVLSAGGYYTKGFSNNPNIMSIWGFDQGFVDYTDLKPSVYYFGATPSASKLSLYEVLRKGKQRIMAKVSKKLVVTEFYQPAEVVTRDALEWLDSGATPQGTPFYLFLHYMDPHDPFMRAGKPGAPVDAPRVGYARARMEHPKPELADIMKRAYNDEIEYLDVYLGKLLDGLRERGLYDNALIVFTADHGEEFYDHGGWWHGQTLYDELMHIPLMVKLPGNARAGETNPYLARHIDLPATMIAFAGLAQPAPMPGSALLAPDFSDLNQGTAFVYAEVDFEGNDLQAVRTYDSKVIHANEDSTRGFASVECYDLAADPSEKANVCVEGQSRKPNFDDLDRLVGEMQTSVHEGAAPPALNVEMSTGVKEQMKALGYLE